MTPSRERRDKASDLHARATPMFGSRAPFSDVFPTVESVEVQVVEIDYGTSKVAANMTLETIRPVVDCSNPRCCGGGVKVQPVLQSLVDKGDAYVEESSLCIGREGSPKGRKTIRACMHTFTVTVTVVYRETAGGPPPA